MCDLDERPASRIQDEFGVELPSVARHGVMPMQPRMKPMLFRGFDARRDGSALVDDAPTSLSVAAADVERLARLVSEAGPTTPLDGIAEAFGSSPLACVAVAFQGMLGRFQDEQAALQRFTWDAAHQLRTPLAVLAARLSADVPPELSDIRRDLEWMSRLVSQLLLAARAAHGFDEAPAEMDLLGLAQDVVSSLAPLAIYRGRGIELVAGDEAVHVIGNSGFAFEAASNLIENAMSYAPEGSIISIVVSAPDRLEVMDRGPGVPEARRQAIFQAFERTPDSADGGAGLGLAIVSEIMRRHGGAVSYRDRPGGGAVFSLQFVPVQQ
jgi:two-component system, OmpR family, sensor histidine kinase TctE